LSGQTLQAPRGTADLLGDRAKALAEVRELCAQILGQAGYEPIETPAFEATELFARGVGEATDIVQKEMYTFTDGSGRSLTLRPEGTAAVCRAYIEHGMHRRPAPVRLWYFGPFFRYERAQAGRYRQFWQVGVEAFGSPDPALDAELIVLLVRIARALGVERTELRLSSLGKPESRDRYRQALQAFLRSREDELAAEVRARIDQNPLRAFDSKDPGTQAVMAEAPLLLDFLDEEDLAHLEAVRELLGEAGIDHRLDPRLVRGLDYYTQTVFELVCPDLGAQSGVGGGGRYDRLVAQLGGPPTPAGGFAAGIERLLLAAGRFDGRFLDPAPDLYLLYTTTPASRDQRRRAFGILASLWEAGLAAQLEVTGRSLRRGLAQAAKVGARLAVLVGEEDRVALKDLGSGEQWTVPADRLVAVAKERLGGNGHPA
jgi:histidyl-tRNA synthetase